MTGLPVKEKDLATEVYLVPFPPAEKQGVRNISCTTDLQLWRSMREGTKLAFRRRHSSLSNMLMHEILHLENKLMSKLSKSLGLCLEKVTEKLHHP